MAGLLDVVATRIKFFPLASNRKFSPRTISRRYDCGDFDGADCVDAAAAIGADDNAYGLDTFDTVFSNFRRFDLYKIPLMFKNVGIFCVDRVDAGDSTVPLPKLWFSILLKFTERN